MLTFHTLSLNIWEPNDRFATRHDWIATATGILLLLSAGARWYGYQHNIIWCWVYGLTGFTLFGWSLDAVLLVLLYFVFFRAKQAHAMSN